MPVIQGNTTLFANVNQAVVKNIYDGGAVLTVSFCNTGTTIAYINVAVSNSQNAPVASQYLIYNLPLTGYQVFDRSSIIVGSGQYLVVSASNNNVVCQAYGVTGDLVTSTNDIVVQTPSANSFTGRMISLGTNANSSTATLVPYYAVGSITTFTNASTVPSSFSTALSWNSYTISATKGTIAMIIDGYAGNVATTTDGITYTAQATLSPNAQPQNFWSGIQTDGTTWVALFGGSSNASTTAAYSTNNGSSWSYVTTPSGKWTSLAYGGGTFLTVSAINGGGTMYSTNAGASWTGGGNQTSGPSSAQNVWNYNLIYAGGSLAAFYMLREGTNQIQVSYTSSGISWSSNTYYTATGLSGGTGIYAAWGNGKFVVVQPGNTASYTSTDGVTWIQNIGAFSANVNGIYFTSLAYLNSRYVATTENYSSYTAGTWISYDGVNWVQGGSTTGIGYGGVLTSLSS